MNNLKTALYGTLAFAAVTFSACNNQSGPADYDNPNHTVNMENNMEKLSYALGANYGKQLKQSGMDSLSKAAFLQALSDVDNDREIALTDQEIQTVIQTEFRKISERKTEKDRAEGAAFLAENAKKDGVIVTESGLQYEILVEGNGPIPKAEDIIEANYVGTFIDGSEFDSSEKAGKPLVIGVSQVIPGWTEALKLMPVGSKWRLVIPYNIAYGERGSGPIPPYSTLVFEMELLGIQGQ